MSARITSIYISSYSHTPFVIFHREHGSTLIFCSPVRRSNLLELLRGECARRCWSVNVFKGTYNFTPKEK